MADKLTIEGFRLELKVSGRRLVIDADFTKPHELLEKDLTFLGWYSKAMDELQACLGEASTTLCQAAFDRKLPEVGKPIPQLVTPHRRKA